MLSQPDATRIAHNQARTDLIFKTFDVKTDRRLGRFTSRAALVKLPESQMAMATKLRNRTVS
jgi:hypothetical protein